MKILNRILPKPALKNDSINKGIAVMLVTLMKALPRVQGQELVKIRETQVALHVPEDHKKILFNYLGEATNINFALRIYAHTSAFVSWLRACPQSCSLADSKDISTDRENVAAWSISPLNKRPSSLFPSPITRLVNPWVTCSVAVRQGSSLGDGFTLIKLVSSSQ